MVTTVKFRSMRAASIGIAVVNIDSELRDYQSLQPGVAATDGVLRTPMLQVMVREEGQWWVGRLSSLDDD